MLAGDKVVHAFLYEAGTMFDLNKLITTDDPLFGQVSLVGAADINDRVYILANGYRETAKNDLRAFILVPVNEPPGWALFAAGLIAAAIAMRQKRRSRQARAGS